MGAGLTRGTECFYFDDPDRLLELCARYGPAVNLSFFLDVAPLGLYETLRRCE